MMRTSGPTVSADLNHMVQGLLREDLDYNRTENRSAHREHLVRSVSIKSLDMEEPVTGFSRNISNSGIGIITGSKVHERTTATLTIECLDGREVKVLAECRWCKRYGKNWQISGWQFLSLR
jgi:hypothetical protein